MLAPPALAPEDELSEVTVGAVVGDTYVNPPAMPPDWLSEFVTVTFTAPVLDELGVATVIAVALDDVTVPAVPLKLTVGEGRKFAPVMTTEVPPPVEPETGLIAEIEGAGC
jgi:hypothetical protein